MLVVINADLATSDLPASPIITTHCQGGITASRRLKSGLRVQAVDHVHLASARASRPAPSVNDEPTAPTTAV